MAKATVEGKVTLELTLDEAGALYSVFEFVGGDPKTTRRKFIDDIASALYKAKVREDVSGMSGGVRFG
jgi:hypothetical protein